MRGILGEPFLWYALIKESFPYASWPKHSQLWKKINFKEWFLSAAFIVCSVYTFYSVHDPTSLLALSAYLYVCLSRRLTDNYYSYRTQIPNQPISSRVYCADIPGYQVSDLVWLRYHADLTDFGYGKYQIVPFWYGWVAYQACLVSLWIFWIDYLSPKYESLFDQTRVIYRQATKMVRQGIGPADNQWFENREVCYSLDKKKPRGGVLNKVLYG